jgi:uncharacterized protein (DUF2249 family)
MNARIVTVDVREDLRNRCEPFSKIMAAVSQLRPEDKLLLVAPFEPAPLLSVLGKQGFDCQSTRLQSGDWEIMFARRPDSQAAFVAPDQPPCAATTNTPTEIIEVDARGLEPPQPMIKILEALASLPAGAELRACTERRPMHLYAQLEERGFAGETKEQSDGSHVTHIRRS